MYQVVRKVSFFRKRVFYKKEPLYKREAKSVKCRGIYLDRTKWTVIRQNSIKQKTLCVYYFLIKRKKLSRQSNIFVQISHNRYFTQILLCIALCMSNKVYRIFYYFESFGI